MGMTPPAIWPRSRGRAEPERAAEDRMVRRLSQLDVRRRPARHSHLELFDRCVHGRWLHRLRPDRYAQRPSQRHRRTRVVNFMPSDGTNSDLQPDRHVHHPVLQHSDRPRVHQHVDLRCGRAFVRAVLRSKRSGTRPAHRADGVHRYELAANVANLGREQQPDERDGRARQPDGLRPRCQRQHHRRSRAADVELEGTFRPTKLYDYYAFNNVTAFCDEHETHQAGADWVSAPAMSDSLCSVHAVPHASFTFTYPSYQPYGAARVDAHPAGLHAAVHVRRLAPGRERLRSADVGDRDPIAQLDGSTVTPDQEFWYGLVGRLRCYSKGNGFWNLSVDTNG